MVTMLINTHLLPHKEHSMFPTQRPTAKCCVWKWSLFVARIKRNIYTHGWTNNMAVRILNTRLWRVNTLIESLNMYWSAPHQALNWENVLGNRSQWPPGLRRWSSAARLLRLWVRIPPGCYVLSKKQCVSKSKQTGRTAGRHLKLPFP